MLAAALALPDALLVLSPKETSTWRLTQMYVYSVVLVRQPQPGIAARTVASWPDRWAASAERLVRAAQPTQTAGTAAPVCPVPLAAHHMLLSLARESEEPLA